MTKQTATIPLEFTLTSGMFLREQLASAEEDGAEIELFLTAGGGRVGVTISKDGTSISYVLSPDVLGNAVYEHWKAGRA